MERLAGRAPRGLGWRLAAVGVLARSASAMSVGALAAFPPSPGLPFSQSPNRSVEPVVLTGSQFPGWSAGPEFTAHAPMSPFNSSTVGQQASEPQQLQSDCYDAQGATYSDGSGYKDNGDHNCYQASQLPVRTLPGRTGADPRRLLGYRWDGHQFVQIPFQVDQVFARYISNNASGFAFYSGTDQQTDYAYDREGFRFLASEAPYSATDTSIPPQVCVAVPFDDRKNNPRSTYDGQATTPSPNGWHLVDKDELSFMARDAGVQAPQGAPAPAGIVDSYQVTVTDPANGSVGFVYVMLGGGNGPAPAYTAANSPYVHYQRDANAGMFVYSQSSYSGYGAAPKGYYCNLDGTLAFDPKTGKPAVGQRRPLDKAWVYTPRYAFRYDGRWLMTAIHGAHKGHDARITNKGKGQPSGLNLDQYGPNIVDRWKARAFQQSPGGDTPCCGYEEEATNWGGSSILLGERTG